MILLLIGRLAQFAIMFLSVKLMTSLLPPVEMGKIALVTTGTAFFALFLVNPVGMFINRRLHAWVESGTMRRYFHLYCGYLLAVAALAACLAWLGTAAGALRIEMSGGWLALLVGGSLFFNTVVQTLVPSLNMLGRSKPFVLLTIATLLAGLAASVCLALAWQPDAEIWLAGALLGQVLFSAVAYKVFFQGDKAATAMTLPDRRRVWRLFHFCWPVALAVGLNWAHMQGYRFLLAERFGLAELGMFAAGYGVAASMMAAIELVLTTWLQPAFYRKANSSDPGIRTRAWRDYADMILPASLLAVSAVVVAAPDLTVLMLGPSYHASGRYVMLGALAEWSRVVVGLFGLSAHLRMDTRALILPNLFGASVALVLMVLLLPTFGLDAAPVAVSIGGVAVATCLYVSGRGVKDHVMSIDWVGLLCALGLIVPLMGLAVVARAWIGQGTMGLAPYAGIVLVCCMWGVGAYIWLNFRSRIVNRREGLV